MLPTLPLFLFELHCKLLFSPNLIVSLTNIHFQALCCPSLCMGATESTYQRGHTVAALVIVQHHHKVEEILQLTSPYFCNSHDKSARAVHKKKAFCFKMLTLSEEVKQVLPLLLAHGQIVSLLSEIICCIFVFNPPPTHLED